LRLKRQIAVAMAQLRYGHERRLFASVAPARYRPRCKHVQEKPEFFRVNHSRRPHARARARRHGELGHQTDPHQPPAGRCRRFLFANSGSGRTMELGRSERTMMRPPAPARREQRGRRAQHPDRQIRPLRHHPDRHSTDTAALKDQRSMAAFNGLKRLPVTAIPVPEHARPSGGLRLRKLFSRR
jgi:hypothetical protein